MRNPILATTVALFLFALILVPIQAENRNFEFTNFNKVSVGWGMHVDITQGQTYRVQVSAEPDTLERLQVDRRGDELRFYFENGGSWNRRGRVSISITMPSLEAINLSGGAQGQIAMTVPNVKFSGEVSGGAELKGQLNSSDLNLSVSGGGEVTLTGSGGNLNLDGSGGSQYNLQEFSVQSVKASLSGGSSATLNMNGTLDGDLSGGSEIVYFGNASMGSWEASGGSKIRKGK